MRCCFCYRSSLRFCLAAEQKKNTLYNKKWEREKTCESSLNCCVSSVKFALTSVLLPVKNYELVLFNTVVVAICLSLFILFVLLHSIHERTICCCVMFLHACHPLLFIFNRNISAGFFFSLQILPFSSTKIYQGTHH